ncbi:MAG: hypothetical protein NTX50_09565 [Candidatus Sumerlaeota bacterium]|nr:hypothetical protein [Candidatus Sumerlaeota bacterium]
MADRKLGRSFITAVCFAAGILWTNLASAQLPGPASSPVPNDGAIDVSTTGMLSWTADPGATTHSVYLGTTIPLTLRSAQTGVTYDPGILISGQTYYWRVDESNTSGVTAGTTWTFTAEVSSGPIAYWKLDETTGTIAADSSGSGKDGAVAGAAVWVPNAGNFNGAWLGNATNTAIAVPALRLYSNQVTFSAWIRRNGTQATNTGIFACRAANTAMSDSTPPARPATSTATWTICASITAR